MAADVRGLVKMGDKLTFEPGQRPLIDFGRVSLWCHLPNLETHFRLNADGWPKDVFKLAFKGIEISIISLPALVK